MLEYRLDVFEMSSNVSVRGDTDATLHGIDRVDIFELSSSLSVRRETEAAPRTARYIGNTFELSSSVSVRCDTDAALHGIVRA